MAAESPKAKEAFADYMALGPDRSLPKLAKAYKTRIGPVATKQLSTLLKWSTDFGWQDRLKALHAEQASRLAEAETDEKIRVLQEGFALRHKRVEALNRLAGKLLEDLDGDRLWVTDVKQIGGGENAERVEVERFNAAEMQEFRALLDDITKETGERVKTEKREVSGALAVKDERIDLSKLSTDDLREYRRITAKAGNPPGD